MTTCGCCTRGWASRTARSAAGRSRGRRPQQIVDRVLELDEGTRFQVLAPVVRGRKGEYTELLRELQAQGVLPGPGGRRGGPAGQRGGAGEPARAEEVREAHHRGGGRPAGGEGVGPAAADRLGGDRARPVRRRGGARLRRPARGRPAPGADVLRASGLPVRRPVVRGARAAVVLVQLAVGRLPGLHRPGHPDGGRPRAGGLRPGQDPGRGRDRRRGAAGTSATTSSG